MTATGIEALTVRPTFSTRYSDEAPKIMPSMVPTMIGNGVSSRIFVAAGMYGSKAGGPGTGASPTMSGYSFSTVLI